MEEVVFDVAMIDPIGPLSGDDIASQVRPVWLVCLGQTPPSELSPQDPTECFIRSMPTDLDHISVCRSPIVADVAKAGAPPSLRGICRLEGKAEARYTVPIAREFVDDGSLLVAMIGSRGSVSSQACADRFLGRQDLTQMCMVARSRLHLGPEDQLREVLKTQGLPELTLDLSATPDPWPPDRNLRIVAFQIGRLDEVEDGVDGLFEGEDMVEVLPNGTFSATADELYALHPVLDVRDIQKLSGREPEEETAEASWYYTSGSGRPARLADPNTGGAPLDHTWSSGARLAEARASGKASRLVHLHVVVRDSRAGVGWASFTAIVQ